MRSRLPFVSSTATRPQWRARSRALPFHLWERLLLTGITTRRRLRTILALHPLLYVLRPALLRTYPLHHPRLDVLGPRARIRRSSPSQHCLGICFHLGWPSGLSDAGLERAFPFLACPGQPFPEHRRRNAVSSAPVFASAAENLRGGAQHSSKIPGACSKAPPELLRVELCNPEARPAFTPAAASRTRHERMAGAA